MEAFVLWCMETSLGVYKAGMQPSVFCNTQGHTAHLSLLPVGTLGENMLGGNPALARVNNDHCHNLVEVETLNTNQDSHVVYCLLRKTRNALLYAVRF